MRGGRGRPALTLANVTAGRLPVWAALGAGIAAYAWWAVGRSPYSAAATVAILLPGVAATLAGTATRPRTARTSEEVRWAPWVAVVAAAGVWQLFAYLQHPRHDHPTVSSLLNALLDSHPARAVAFILWIAAALYLARR